jgi:integrase
VEKLTILGGKVHVYKRDNSRFWQCSTYLAGRKRRASTHQELLPRAEEVAEDWYLELRGKVRTGELSGGRTFDQAAEQFLREYLVITGGERNAKYVEDHQSRLRNHLIPFFGKIHLTRITAGKVQEYRVHRMSSDRANAVAAKTFEQAAQEFELEYRGPRKALEFESHKLRLATHLVPYFAGLKLSELTHERIEAYRAHRQAEINLTAALGKEALHKELATLGLVIRWAKRLSRPPTRSTMHHEIVTLRQVLKTAIRHGWLAHLPDLSTPYRASSKVTHRAWFAPEEYKLLYKATRKHAHDGKGRPWQWAAEQLHDYVLFMVNTGIRPDEAGRLEYRDVKVVRDAATEETILEIEVRGKRGVGYCKSMNGAVLPYQRMMARNSPKPTDRIFGVNHKKQFGGLLEKLGLKLDREGNRRTAYSLRHTYICLRLMEGADIYQIAKNCRTSVEMIENYYASHIKNVIDAAAVNVRRNKLPTTDIEAPARQQPSPCRGGHQRGHRQ